MTLVVVSGKLPGGMTETKLQRLEWLVEHRAKGIQRELARMAKLAPSHIGTILTRLRKNPDADIEGDTLSAIAEAAEVNETWLASGRLPRDRREPGESSTPRYASLDLVLQAFPDRWDASAVAAAQSQQLHGDDPGEAWWVQQLDRLEQAIRLASMPLPPKIRVQGDPLSDLDEPPVRDARKKTR